LIDRARLRDAPNGSGTCGASTTWRGTWAGRERLTFPGLPGSAASASHGGSEDHTAILACKIDHVSLYTFRAGHATRRRAHARRTGRS
jgi:hypothetical protein